MLCSNILAHFSVYQRSTESTTDLVLSQHLFSFEDVMSSLDDRVGVQGYRVDAAFDEKFGKLGIVRRSLPADAYLFVVAAGGVYSHRDHFFDRAVSLIEQVSNHFRIAVEA